MEFKMDLAAFLGLQKMPGICTALRREFEKSRPQTPHPTCVWHMRSICQKDRDVLSVAMAYAWHFIAQYSEIIEVQICQAYADVAHKPRSGAGWGVLTAMTYAWHLCRPPSGLGSCKICQAYANVAHKPRLGGRAGGGRCHGICLAFM